MKMLHLAGCLLVIQAALLWTTSHGAACFSVFRNLDLPAGANPLPFIGYTVNDGQAFDLDTDHFVVPQSGWYWLHWSVGMEEGTQVNVSLEGTTRSPNILRLNSSFVGSPVTTSRDDLVQLEAGDEIWLSSSSGLFGDDFKQITFSGFDLSDVTTNTTVAFSVALSNSLVNGAFEKIPYDVIVADSHMGWNTTSREYVVPVNGTYVITAVTGAVAADVFAHDLLVDDGVQFRQLVSSAYFYNSHRGPDTVSRTVIATLHAGERLFTRFYYPGYSVYSDSGYQTSLQAFRYDHPGNPVAWSVKRNTGAGVTGPEDPFVFNTVLSNLGGAWQAESNTVVVSQSGIYYVHISAGVYYAAAMMDIVINGLPYANIHHESVNQGFSSHSRAIFIRMNAGTELHVQVPAGYTLSDLPDCESTFAGFLIH